jgi:hypothetical protein
MCKKLDLLLLMLMTITTAHLFFLRVNVFSRIRATKRIGTVSTNAWRRKIIRSLPICQPRFLACKNARLILGIHPH